MPNTKRKLLAVLVMSLALLASVAAQTNQAGAGAKTIRITRNNTQPPPMREAENFTGSVGVESLVEATAPSPLTAARVTFAPGARTAWHSHPMGQTLVVTAGIGWVQSRGGEKQEIRPGDVVWTPPGVQHWHGATATDRLTHIALTEQQPDGKRVEWMEKVSDAQYTAPLRTPAATPTAPNAVISNHDRRKQPSATFHPSWRSLRTMFSMPMSGNAHSFQNVTAVW